MALQNRMNEEQLKDWILRRLGAPMRTVELCPDNLTDAVETARRWFTAKKGVFDRMKMPLSPAKLDYDLPEVVDTVLDVTPPLSASDLSLLVDPFSLYDGFMPYAGLGGPAPAWFYSGLVQRLGYIEQAKRVLSVEFEWRQDSRRLFISPDPRSAPFLIIDFKSRMPTIEQLDERDHDILKRYALAQAMLDLATVRGKNDAYPTAQGMTHLDAERLYTNAFTMIEKLEEEIAQSAYAMPFVTG